MKDKWYVVCLLIILLGGVGTMWGDERESLPAELPQSAQQVLKTYFSGEAVVEYEHSKVWNEYVVKLRSGYKLQFSKTGEWIEITGGDILLSSPVLNLLPDKVVRYVRLNYPNNRLNGIRQAKSGYRLSLVKPHHILYFSRAGEFLKQKKD